MVSVRGNSVYEWRNFWALPVASALGYSISVLHLYGVGSFIEPLQEEFGWSRTQISLGITVVGLVGAALSVPIGMLVDRVGPRAVGLVGAPAMALAFALLGTATGSTFNWIALWLLVALGNLGLQATVWTSAIATRFEKSRGLAFALAFCGGSLGAAVFPVLATWLIGTFGWRIAFMAMSGIWLLVVFPFMFGFFRGVRDSPRKTSALAPNVTELEGVSIGTALRSSSFYKLVMTSGFLTFTNVAIIVHFIPILRERGADELTAAGVASVIGIASIVGRLSAGVLLDRFSGNVVGSIALCLPIVACVLLTTFGESSMSQIVAAACFGLTVGAEVDVVAYLASRHFGLKNYGVLFGVIISALTLGVALGPLAAGAAYDAFGGYSQFLILTIGLMAVSSLAMLSLSRPTFNK